MPKLKACPFCGCDARVIGDGDHWYVNCAGTDCFCALGEIWDRDAMPDHHFPTERDAAIAWNKRAKA